jgi:catechol 2,3-dioxygenase-like lactoylglutathione lyase family enzyme
MTPVTAKLSCTLVHVDLTVADMERSLAFYTGSLGLLVQEDCTLETKAARFLSGGKAGKMRVGVPDERHHDLVHGSRRAIPRRTAEMRRLIIKCA